MKKFVFFVVLVVFGMVKFKQALSSGQALAYFDSKPHQKGSATCLYLLGNFYELTNNYKMSEKSYRLVMEKYPKFKHAENSGFGWAHAIELQKDYPRAIAAYEEFLTVFPDSKNAEMVRKNISIIR